MTDSPTATGCVASGIGVRAMRRGYVLMSGLLLATMVAGTQYRAGEPSSSGTGLPGFLSPTIELSHHHSRHHGTTWRQCPSVGV